MRVLSKIAGFPAGIILLFMLCLQTAQAQVPNNDIEKRRLLKTEEISESNTLNCTVQRSCVDEKLTGKCVEYHNDQWFEFTPAAFGDYFVNISGQQCRDTRGVQLVVFTGKPCLPESYQILSCTSLGSQDDVFVSLEGLKAKQTYFLNLDGYLNDQCRFRIAVSNKAQGMPATVPPPTATAILLPNALVPLSWSLPDSVKAASFRILRREIAQFKATEIARVPVKRDSYGVLVPSYTYTDTLPQPGNYLYSIVANEAEDAGVPVLLRQQWFHWQSAANTPLWVNLPLGKYPNGATLTVIVTDAATGKLLRNVQLTKRRNKSGQEGLFVSEWLAQGIKRIRVEISRQQKGRAPEVTRLLIDLTPETGKLR